MGGKLEGRVALISGSTRGIGRSTAELFAAEGAKVAVTGRTVDRGERVAQRIRDAGGEAEFFRLDVADEASVRDTVDAVVDRFGGLTTLVNNAAPTLEVSQSFKPMAEYTTQEWDRILTATLTGNVFWATKYAWPHLVASGPGAAIVNVSSGAAVRGHHGISAYTAAKGGLNSVTRTIAVEGMPHGIRCNGIVVGRVVASRGDAGPELQDARFVGSAVQIATVALFLACDDSSFVNGELITADGGLDMRGNISGS